MRKPINEYMDDPDIIGEHPAIREIHAIRLMIYDETKDLTPDEHTAYFRKGAERVIAGGCVADKARK